ncbi:DUF192 domain-containing protein [Candidatus Pacearchaeota archaeon]|nr:DUF192 domain-containing protein [Candidatus Pacearchaeota archaeon]
MDEEYVDSPRYYLKEPCETYTSSGPAKYVLEVNAGFAEKNGLKAGDSVF